MGTANSLVYSKGRGIVVSEPSIVAVNQKTGKVEAVGKEAKEMLGRTPGNIIAIRPMKDGVIADFEHTERMLSYFIEKAHNRKFGVRPRIVIGVPSEITQVEKRAVRDSAMRAKATEVYLVEQAMMAAIGAGLPITEPTGNMVLDIGGGTSDVAVISMAGIVYARSVRVAGNEMDEAIIQYIKRKYNLLIGERTAEEVKIKLGLGVSRSTRSSRSRSRAAISWRASRRRSSSRTRRSARPWRRPSRRSSRRSAPRSSRRRRSCRRTSSIAASSSPAAGRCLKNLDKRLREETGLPVSIADDPLTSVVMGTGKMLTDFDLLRRVALD